ncbi:helix-turn-helix domain-containing protein [Embleya sp. NPDC127516]|uniref:helix-turn-helix domain-containing protein n=1 Tax=Embleya sp. NPDC127516 TaxID=3363990 RepID=UPI0037F4D1B4
MGRTERSLESAGSPITTLAQQLRLLRKQAGLTFREMAENSTIGYTHTTFSRVGGGKLLTEKAVREFTEICGGDYRRIAPLLRQARKHKHVAGRSGTPRAGRTAMHPPNVSDEHDLLLAMKTIRLAAGQPSLREIEYMAEDLPGGTRLARSTVGEVLQGKQFPTRAFVETFATVCGASRSDIRAWKRAWTIAKAVRDDLPRPDSKLATSRLEKSNIEELFNSVLQIKIFEGEWMPSERERKVAVADLFGRDAFGDGVGASSAQTLMQTSGFAPIVKFPGRNRPWKSKCLRCDSIVHPRLLDVVQRRFACEHCVQLAVRHPRRKNTEMRVVLGETVAG